MNIRALAVVLAVLAGGCSSVSLDDARALATNGETVASADAAFIVIPRQQHATYVSSLSLASRMGECNTYALTPMSSEGLERASNYFSELASVQAFFLEAAATYRAFGDLASYDSAQQVETGLGGMTAAGNDFAAKVKAPAIPANVGGVISKLGGMTAEEVQKRKLEAGSVAIRERLEPFAAALRKYKAGFLKVRQEDSVIGYEVAETLWCAGLIDARPALRQIIAGYGFDLADGGKAITATTTPSLKKPVASIFQAKRAAALDEIATAYDQVIAGLDALIAEHRKFEQGQPVDGEYLQKQILNIRTLVESALKS